MRSLTRLVPGALAIALFTFTAAPAAAKFRSLQRQTGSTHADVALQFVLPDDLGFDVLRSDLYGEFALGALGAYAAIPLTNSIDGPDDISAVGNLELGVIGHLGFDTASVTLHAGVAVPTADDSIEDVFINIVGSVPRIEDAFASVLPDTTSIRLGAAPRLQAGPLFAQADVGVDFLLIDIDGADNETAYHLGLGLGADIGFLEFTAEVVHADVAGDSAFNDNQTFTAGATLDLPIVKPFASYTTLLGDGAGDVHVVAFGASVGF